MTPALLLQGKQGEVSWVFCLFSLDGAFTSGLAKLFQLFSFPPIKALDPWEDACLTGPPR